MLIGYAFCGSFCTHGRAVAALEELKEVGHEIIPVFSEIVQKTDTRFGRSCDLEDRVEKITGRDIIKTIPEAEAIITRGKLDCMIVSPCTGNTLAKIAGGITDGVVTMAVKAQLRNNRPVLLALATNDALGTNFKNIALCNDKKNIYFVPIEQDDPHSKPTSAVCDFKLLSNSLLSAVKGLQIQPMLL